MYNTFAGHKFLSIIRQTFSHLALRRCGHALFDWVYSRGEYQTLGVWSRDQREFSVWEQNEARGWPVSQRWENPSPS
jgi:hypothetical protein